jgi:hypothetical protein
VSEPEIILTDEDVDALFGPREEVPGYIYYDARSGNIRSIAEGVQTDLDLPFIEVPVERARAFMSGEESLSDVMVAYRPGDDRPVLTSRSPDTIAVKPAQGWTQSDDDDTAPVVVTFGIPRDHPIGTVSFDSNSRVEFSDEPIRVRLSPRGKLDEITCEFDLDLSPLNSAAEMHLDLGLIIPFDVDAMVTSLSSTAFRVVPYSSENRPLPPPKGRNRIHQATSVEGIRGIPGGLVIDYMGDRVVVHLHQQGGHYYDLPLESLMLSFSRRNDPEAVLWFQRVSVEDLRAGKRIEFELDSELGEFDAFTQIYWENVYVRDLTQVEDDYAILPRPPGNGLIMAQRLREDAQPGMCVRFRKHGFAVVLVGDGGRQYEREGDTFRMSVFRESLEFPVWVGEIPADHEILSQGYDVEVDLGALDNLRVAIEPIYEFNYWAAARLIN